MGLTITKRLVELMGGEIRVCSKVGEGSQFKFTIPYYPEGQVDVIQDQPEDRTGGKINEERTILIAEDNNMNRVLLRKVLEKMELNMVVIEAKDGMEAVKLAKQEMPNLIFMDLMMPEIDGYTANQIIKENSETRGIPVIAWTAKGMYEEEKRILTEFEGILRKPSQKESIKEIVARFL